MSWTYPVSANAPAAGSVLEFDGTNIIPATGLTKVVYNTSAPLTGSAPATTMFTTPSIVVQGFLFTYQLSLEAIGIGCTSPTTITPSIIFRDASQEATVTHTFPTVSITGNGTLGFLDSQVFALASGQGPIQYAITFTPGAGCDGVTMEYLFLPTLLQLW